MPEVWALTAATRLSSDVVSAAGALYAPEVQQPATERSERVGPKTHYHLPSDVVSYFEIHSHNEHEAQKVAVRIHSLPAEDQSRAVQSCSEIAEALWNALSDIYGKEEMSGG